MTKPKVLIVTQEDQPTNRQLLLIEELKKQGVHFDVKSVEELKGKSNTFEMVWFDEEMIKL